MNKTKSDRKDLFSKFSHGVCSCCSSSSSSSSSSTRTTVATPKTTTNNTKTTLGTSTTVSPRHNLLIRKIKKFAKKIKKTLTNKMIHPSSSSEPSSSSAPPPPEELPQQLSVHHHPHDDENYLKNSGKNIVPEANKTNAKLSYKEMITATAACLKESFPSYKHLTIGDIVFGLSCLANEHSKNDVIGEEMRNPILYNRSNGEEETDEEYKWWNEHSTLNHHHHDNELNTLLQEQLIFAKRMLYYANLAYYNVANETERAKVQKALLEGYESLNQSRSWFSSSPQPKYSSNSLKYLESLRYETNLLFYVNISEANQQAFFVKMVHDLKTVIIAIRGTSQLADIFTNLSAENSDLKVHRFYGDYKRKVEKREHLIDTADFTFDVENNNHENFCESDDNEQMIHGKVHAGYINTARWILSKIRDFLLNNIFSNTSDYKSYRIITVGHSLGGGLAAVRKLNAYFERMICKLN